MIGLLVGMVLGFFLMGAGVPLVLGLARLLGIYTTVEERSCRVYVFFGKVLGIIDEPGLHFLWPRFGWKSLLLNTLGSCHVIDLRLDQQYLRSQPVNSEEGAPMGIGIWYEMSISDPLKYLFDNADPRGSLAANVSNAAVRCLSNMRLENMMEDRHAMSRAVRSEVSPMSSVYGYKLGSVYIRKVHFRDEGMIRQIEEKVVNRLRQVTSAIRQDGANQVSIITSSADRQAAIAFAKAAALRPQIVGESLRKIVQDSEVATAMFEILEVQRLQESSARVTLIPESQKGDLLTQMLAAAPATPSSSKK